MILGIAVGTLLGAAVAVHPEVSCVPRAHSHNDYEQARPLFDALDQGFCSVEADVHTVDGKLLVAHDRRGLRPDRTLQSLYLDPLRDRVRTNHGRVYPGGPEFFLLIDFKTAAEPTWSVLRPVLDEYAEMLTLFGNDRTETNAVTIVISGNAPRAALAAEPQRRAAIDGTPADLDGDASRHLVPWMSENWRSRFSWRGEGTIPAQDLARLIDLVHRAHTQGRRVRFWGGPDIEPLWRVQHAAGVDFINTDKLAQLRSFLLQTP